MTGQDPEQLSSSDVLGILTGSPENLKPARFRISRPCYDKFHRCPGWAGGGMRYARTRRCDNGRIRYYNEERHDRLWMWRLYRCPKCRVIVLPYMIRWVDISWWRFKININTRYHANAIHLVEVRHGNPVRELMRRIRQRLHV